MLNDLKKKIVSQTIIHLPRLITAILALGLRSWNDFGCDHDCRNEFVFVLRLRKICHRQLRKVPKLFDVRVQLVGHADSFAEKLHFDDQKCAKANILPWIRDGRARFGNIFKSKHISNDSKKRKKRPKWIQNLIRRYSKPSFRTI